MSRNYTLDENTYPQFLRNDDEEIDLLSFIRTVDPTKVRIGKRQRDEDEPKILETTIGHVAPAQLKRQKKQKTKVVDAGEPSHPAKKLRDDYEAPSGPIVGGVNIAETEVDSVVKTSMPIITSATTTPAADPAAIAKEKLIDTSVFGADSPSASKSHPIFGGFSNCSGSDFLVGERRRLKAIVDEKNQVLKVMDEEIENLKAQLLLKEAEAAEAIRLRAETSKLEAAEKSLWDEVTALNERNTILEKERNALDVKVTDLQAVVV
nr:hypothetical protein [Tanacetum cinerariifolium]